MRFRKLIPNFKIITNDTVTLKRTSWLGFTSYTVDTPSYTFMQYGKNPVKFVLKMKDHSAAFPSFVLSHGWETVVNKKRRSFGTTTKPLNIEKMWRNIDGPTAAKAGILKELR